MLGAGHDPNTVFMIVGNNVQLPALFVVDHRIVLSMDEEYWLGYSLHDVDWPHISKIRVEERAPCQNHETANQDGRRNGPMYSWRSSFM